MYSLSYLEPVCFSMSSSNYCFLTCIQISQEASQVAWYSHLFKNFPQFVMIHTVKGFGIVNKAVDFFSRAFLMIQQMLAIWSLVPLSFLNPTWTSGSSAWRILSNTLLLLLSCFSHVWLWATQWMTAHQASPSLGFSRQEHWSGLPFPSPMHESEKWKWSRSVVFDSSDPMDCSLPGSSIHGIF